MCGASGAAGGRGGWRGHLGSRGHELERSSRNLFHNNKEKTTSLTHGDDFVVTGSKGESVGAQEAGGECISNQSEHHRRRFGKEHQAPGPENMLESEGGIVST